MYNTEAVKKVYFELIRLDPIRTRESWDIIQTALILYAEQDEWNMIR